MSFSPTNIIHPQKIVSVACHNLKELKYAVIVSFPFPTQQVQNTVFVERIVCLAGKALVSWHGSKCLNI
jgi:hypothetical protein